MTEPAFVAATRDSYSAIAVPYHRMFGNARDRDPLERALWTMFAELIEPNGLVADIGCGPGLLTAHLNALGLNAFGIDLAPGMIDLARRDHPGLRFEEGSMLALDLANKALAGLIANYSIIHLPADHLPTAFAEFHRVLKPGAPVLIAHQTDGDLKHYDDFDGHPINLDFHRHPQDLVVDLLEKTGFDVRFRAVREPESFENLRQSYVVAKKTGGEA